MSNFLKEDNGNLSAVRIGFMLCILTACIIGVYGVYKDSDLLTLAGLVGTYLGAAYGGKVWQKKSEQNVEQ